MTAELLQRLFMDEDVETDKDEASTMKKEVKNLNHYSSENLSSYLFYIMALFYHTYLWYQSKCPNKI